MQNLKSSEGSFALVAATLLKSELQLTAFQRAAGRWYVAFSVPVLIIKSLHHHGKVLPIVKLQFNHSFLLLPGRKP